MKNVLILGASSAIASQTAKQFAREEAVLFLADVSISRLEAVRDDILTHYPTKIYLEEFDALNFEAHKNLIDKAISKMGQIDAVLIAYGTLPDQFAIQSNVQDILKEFSINCTSIISFLTILAEYFEKRKSGTIAVISSVAGDRGRQSNYIYGSAKGALTLFLSGLRGRLFPHGVKVITIKPGLVDTPMTAHLDKNPLYASSEAVGKGIFNAMKSGKDTVYLPSFWRLIMCFVKFIPEKIFKKLKF